MANGVTYAVYGESPYLTLPEFKNAPTALSIATLVPGGTQGQQDAELTNLINRASSLMDEFLNQSLVAQINVEALRARVSNQGFFTIHPKNDPVNAVTAFSYGGTPTSLISLSDCSGIWFEPQQITVPLGSSMSTSAGPLQFGGGVPGQQAFIKLTYDSGYTETLCSGTATQSTVTVLTNAGITPGSTYKIFDGANTETVTVTSSFVYGSSLVIPLTAPLAFTHTSVSFSGMPQIVKDCCIAVTSALLRRRGDAANAMVSGSRPGPVSTTKKVFSDPVAQALDSIDSYRRIR